MTNDALRKHLTTLIEGTVSRRSFDEIVRDVPPEARGVQPEALPEAYSLWQILEHTRICQTDYLDYCRNPDYEIAEWPDDFWPDTVAPPSDAAWHESIDRFRADIQSAKELVADPDIDLDRPIPHATEVMHHGTTYADQLTRLVDHNAYHLGQMVTVRRLLGVWPPEGLEPPSWETEEASPSSGSA